jgi:hypothetical protein
MEHGDVLPVGTMMDNFDFHRLYANCGSSTNGYLSINHELTPGGVTAMNCFF